MKKVVGTFESISDACNAMREIRTAGFLATDVDLVVRNAKEGDTFDDRASASSSVASGAIFGALAGGALGSLAGLTANLMGVLIPGFGSILSAGLVSTALAGAGVGAIVGSLVSGLTNLSVSRKHTQYQVESLRRGGALVGVHADESRVDEVERILHQQGAYVVEDRVVQWRNTGWPGDKPEPSSPR